MRNLALPVLLTILGAALTGVIIISCGMGYIKIPAPDIIKIISASLRGIPFNGNAVFQAVIMDIRLPRILTAALVGGGLAVAGVVFQAVLLNPLADPYTLGVSSGAAFGASLALILSLTMPTAFSVPLFAFAGALAAMTAVLYLAENGGTSANTLILSGVIVAAILSAGIGFIKYLADEQVSIIIFWLMGSFASRTWHDVELTLTVVVATSLIILFYGRDLNIMALGSRSAASLGVNTARNRKILIVTASLLTAVCVSVSGIIGFIGLIIPHLMRMVAGPDNRRLLPASFLAGALLLLGADTISRAVLPSEVPIGILTSLIGGPFFCYIFRRRQLGR